MTKKNNNSNNGWKRIAAGALSMALVAGALPANVGGFLTIGQGIVASAGKGGEPVDYDATDTVDVRDIVENDTFAEDAIIQLSGDSGVGYTLYFDYGTTNEFVFNLVPGGSYQMTGAYKCVDIEDNDIFFERIVTAYGPEDTATTLVVGDTFVEGAKIKILDGDESSSYLFAFDNGTPNLRESDILHGGDVYTVTGGGTYKFVGSDFFQRDAIKGVVCYFETVVTPTAYNTENPAEDPTAIKASDTFANGTIISVPEDNEDAYTIIIDGDTENPVTIDKDNPYTVTFDGDYADKFIYKCVSVDADNKTINLETVDTRIVPTVDIGAIAGLAQNGEDEQQLVEFTNDGGENGYGAIHFRLGEEGQWTDNLDGIDSMKASDAGTYTVYWYTEETDDLQGIGSRDEPKSVEVTIAAKYAINNLTEGEILPAGTVITAVDKNQLYLDGMSQNIDQNGYTLLYDTVVVKSGISTNSSEPGISGSYYLLVSITGHYPFVEDINNIGTFTSNNINFTAAYSEFKINVEEGKSETIDWSITYGNPDARLYIWVDGEPYNPAFNVTDGIPSGTIVLTDAGKHIIKVAYAIANNGSSETNDPYVTIRNSKLRFADMVDYPTYEVEAAELEYTGEDQELVDVKGEGGTIHYRYRKHDDNNNDTNDPHANNTPYSNWSTEVPKATDIGTYDVQWYSEQADMFYAYGTEINPQATVQVKIAPGSVEVGFVDDIDNPIKMFILDDNNNDVTGKALTCGETYYIYSNKTLDYETDILDGLTVSSTTLKNKVVNGVKYNYMYTIKTTTDVPSKKHIKFAHKHAAEAFNKDNEHTTTNQVWVKCVGEPSSEAGCVAELITKDIYYYGEAPTDNDITLARYYGATPGIKDFYFTLKGDEGATRLKASQLEVGNDYIVNGVIAVAIDDKVTYIAIEKEISYQAKPINDCNISVKNGNEYIPVSYKQVWVEEEDKFVDDKSTIVIPDIFTYNSFNQSPVIVVKNDVLGTMTTLTKNDYTNQITPQTNAGDYSGTLTAVEKEDAKYCGTLNVEWSIARADVSDLISIEPIFNADEDENGINDAITYDGQILDVTDFTVSAAPITDEDSASVKARKTLAAKFVDEIKSNKTKFTVAGALIKPEPIEENVGGEGEYEEAILKPAIDEVVPSNSIEVLKETISTPANEITEIIEALGKKYDFTSAGNQKGVATLTNDNYVGFEKLLELTIAKRAVNITPDANQVMIFGANDDPELTFTVEEENKNAHTGFIKSDLDEEETVAEFFDGVIKVGREIETTNVLNPNDNDDFDNEVFDNDAGTYEFALANDFTNYKPVLVGDAVFTVEPKDINSEDIVITLAPADEKGKKIDKQFIIGEDNIPSLDFNNSTQYVIVDSIKDKSIKDSNDALTKDIDFVVGGTTQKYLPGSFNVQIVGENNYTGIAYSPWQINPLSGSSVIKCLPTDDSEEFNLLDGQKYYDGEDITELFEIAKIPGATIITSFLDEDGNILDGAPTKAGEYTVKVTVKQEGHLETEESVEVTILPRPVEVTAEAVSGTVTYSYGGPGVGEPTFEGILEDEEEDFLATASVDWTLDETNDLYTGEVVTTDEYNNNYDFRVEDVKFEVVAKDISSADIRVFYPDKTNMSEGKFVTCSDITVIDVRNGRKLELGADYTLNGNTSQIPGEFTIEVVGKAPHYKGVKEVPWVVVAEDEDVISPRVLSYRTYGKNQIEFTVNNAYNGSSENVEYGVLLTNASGKYAENMTLEDVDGKVIHNAPLKFKTSVFRAQDNGKGVSARPYMKVDGNVTYGKQVYVTFKELSITTEAMHSEIMSCSKEDEKGTLRFTANFNLGDDTDAKYGVLITNKKVDELTPENALVDHECKYTISSFTASANGENGITMRTYILKDGVYKFGPQVTYNYADYS